MKDTPSVEEITLRRLITEENVKKVLAADKGNDVHLISWRPVDFAEIGGISIFSVTSIEVKYSVNNEEHAVSYIGKLNALGSLAAEPDISPLLFAKEAGFYQQLLPALNKILDSAGQPPFRMPKCFLAILEDGKQQIYLEDLRGKGFKLFDKRKGMDKEHTSLVLSELARLHSASYLLMDGGSPGAATERFDFLGHELLDLSGEAGLIMKELFEKDIDISRAVLEKTGGYDMAIDELKNIKRDIDNVMPAIMKSEKFNSINHGDCWNDNVLFRYDDQGCPLEVMLIDPQLCREASIASDLNFFLFTSLTCEIRKENIDYFMSLYYSSYKTVFEGAGQSMFFREEEIMKEFQDKYKLGLIFSMSVIPSLILDLEKTPDLTEAEKIRAFVNNPLFRTRFISIFDELIESGGIS